MMNEVTRSCYQLQKISGVEGELYIKDVQSESHSHTNCCRKYLFGEEDSPLIVGSSDNRGLFTVLDLTNNTSNVYCITVAQSGKGDRAMKLSPTTTKWNQFQFLPHLSIIFVHVHSNKMFYAPLRQRNDEETAPGDVFVLNKMSSSIAQVEVSPTGQRVACVSTDGELDVLDMDESFERPVVLKNTKIDLSNLFGIGSKRANYRIFFVSEELIAVACDLGRLIFYSISDHSKIQEFIIESSIAHLSDIIQLDSGEDLLLGNMLGTVFRIRIAETIEVVDIMYSNLAGEKSEITWLSHFNTTTGISYIICTKGTSNSIQLFNEEGQLYLHYGPFEQEVVYCTVVTENNSGSIEERLLVVFSDGSGAAWTLSKLLIETSEYHNDGCHPGIQFEDYVSEGDGNESEAMTYSEFNENESVLSLGTVDEEVTVTDEEEMLFDEGEFPMKVVPQPEPYPNHSKPKEDHRVFKRKPTVSFITEPERLEFESSSEGSRRDPRSFNYGNNDKIQDTLSKLSSNKTTVFPTSPVVLNSTRLLRNKIEKMKNAKFKPNETTGPIELSSITPETSKVLNYKPDDRMFSNLPEIEMVINPSEKRTKESGKDNNLKDDFSDEKDIYKKKKRIGKQVDQEYLDQLEKNRPALDDMKKFYDLEQEILVRHSFVFKPKKQKPRYHCQGSRPSFIMQYLEQNPL